MEILIILLIEIPDCDAFNPLQQNAFHSYLYMKVNIFLFMKYFFLNFHLSKFDRNSLK